MERKRCRICGEEKPIADFHLRASARDGHHSACKPCAMAEQNRSRAKAYNEFLAVGMKACASCKQIKTLEEFPRNKNYWDGRNHICKDCNYGRRATYEKTSKTKINATRRTRYQRNLAVIRDARVSHYHRIPRGSYDLMLEAQGGVCAICGRGDNPGKTRFAIDHSHNDERAIRGLLCTCCNQALGQLQDSPELLRKAAAYLENPPAKHLNLTSALRGDPRRKSAGYKSPAVIPRSSASSAEP